MLTGITLRWLGAQVITRSNETELMFSLSVSLSVNVLRPIVSYSLILSIIPFPERT